MRKKGQTPRTTEKRSSRKAEGTSSRSKDQTPISRKANPEEERSKAESAFWGLDRVSRDRVRAEGKYDSYEEWYTATHDRQKEGRAHRQGKGEATSLTISHDKKFLDKHIREAMKIPTKNKPFVALLQPTVIVADDAIGKSVIADAGSIVKLMDQTVLYRDYMSPITHRADEILVQYGNAKTLALGWIANKLAVPINKAMVPSRGPVFLVKTSSEDALTGWDRLRLKVARARPKDPKVWIAVWLAHHGQKFPRELREVTRLFGGKPIKNEDVEVRIERLFSLILHTELDMATAKSKKIKKSKTAKSSKSTKPEKKTTAKNKFSEKSDLVSKKYNDYVIKRLIKENPFREGSNRAKLWSKLKKGMTVIEFNAFGAGRARTELRHYRASGWIKLRRPAA